MASLATLAPDTAWCAKAATVRVLGENTSHDAAAQNDASTHGRAFSDWTLVQRALRDGVA